MNMAPILSYYVCVVLQINIDLPPSCKFDDKQQIEFVRP
jgi:hypothetical protein